MKIDDPTVYVCLSIIIVLFFLFLRYFSTGLVPGYESVIAYISIMLLLTSFIATVSAVYFFTIGKYKKILDKIMISGSILVMVAYQFLASSLLMFPIAK
jgi:hypothetical protein